MHKAIKMEHNINSILKKSAIFAFLASGAYFIIKSLFEPSVLGATIGTQSTSYSIMIGITLFMITLAISFHHDKEYKAELIEEKQKIP